MAALQLGRPHLDHLPAASDERFQFTGLSRDQRLSYDAAHLTEVGDHSGVDAVCLRELALRAGEVTNLTGVDHGNRNTDGAERDGQGYLIAPGGFHDDALRVQGLELENQSVYPFLALIDSPGVPRRAHRDIHPFLRHVDPYEHRSISRHGFSFGPSLQIRARWPRQLFGLYDGERRGDHANPRSCITQDETVCPAFHVKIQG